MQTHPHQQSESHPHTTAPGQAEAKPRRRYYRKKQPANAQYRPKQGTSSGAPQEVQETQQQPVAAPATQAAAPANDAQQRQAAKPRKQRPRRPRKPQTQQATHNLKPDEANPPQNEQPATIEGTANQPKVVAGDQPATGEQQAKRGGHRGPRGPRKPKEKALSGAAPIQQGQPAVQSHNQDQNKPQDAAQDNQAQKSSRGTRRNFRVRIDTRFGNCAEERGPPRRPKGQGAGGEGGETPATIETTKDPERPVEKEGEFFYEAGPNCFGIKKGFVPNMNVDGLVFVNANLRSLLMEELKVNSAGGFLPAIKQVANVASLPGILQYSMGMPDIHCGYGFAIGNVAAFDMSNPEAVVSPGGVGFDINCGVRLVRTNLMEKDVAPHKEDLAQLLFEKIPVGVGSGGSVKITQEDLTEILNTGVDWAVKHGIAWEEDKEFCEEDGHMKSADASKVSARAKKRGLQELGSLGAGNHYCEVQVVDEIFDQAGADALGLGKVGQVCAMVHCGSRGLGHQIATDFLQTMEKTQHEQKIELNDRQLACARVNSEAGQDYLKAMACAANFAWVNRQGIMHQIRQSFEKVFNKTARELDMQLVYDVSHNTAKVEDHVVDGQQKQLLVHRKGATRAFPPKHKLIPKAYSAVGQPVFIGGSMGTNSYVLLGTEKGMEKSFGSTCHGAGRCLSRHKSRTTVSSKDVMDRLKSQGIAIRIQTPKLIMEEAPETYKDVNEVVRTCDEVGLSKICVRLRPLAVIKG